MSEHYQTQEVGSLAKPEWRVKLAAGHALSETDLTQANDWATRLGIEQELVGEVLLPASEEARQLGSLGCGNREAVNQLASNFAVKLQERAGLDIIFDGEQRRSEMYQFAVDHIDGFNWRGRVRAFDNKSYRKAACVAEPANRDLAEAHLQELAVVKDLTDKTVKFPITGAYTLAAWSFDEYYTSRVGASKARERLTLDLATRVIRPTIQKLLAAGAEWIQIDEPAATTVPGEVPLFVRSFNESVRDLVGKFSVHVCFSDYSRLFPAVDDIENCAQFSLEFANRDGQQLGIDAAHRPAYDVLQQFHDHQPNIGIGLGVTSVHDDHIESPQLVRDRILRATELVGSPAHIFPSPDCGLRTRSWEISAAKLDSVVAGTRLASNS